jgi:hypothetical protein
LFLATKAFMKVAKKEMNSWFTFFPH